MSVLDLAEAILKQYPDLSYSVEDGSITVAPPTSDGFSVSLRLDEQARDIWVYVAGYDGGLFDIEDECAALNCFVWCLTDRCRLKVEKRGDRRSALEAEYRDGEEWNWCMRMSVTLVPFWRKKSVEYRQNSVIEDTHGFGPPFDPEEGATAVIKLLENAGIQYSPKTSSDTYPQHVWGKSSIRYFPQTFLEEEFHVTYSDGSRYEGDWKDGKEHGRGVYVWADGDECEGDWREGKLLGMGEALLEIGQWQKFWACWGLRW